jgi:hypothetical protein
MAIRTYRLTVEGELGDHLASAFPGLTLSHGDGTTTLTGEMRDQSELQGVLQRISDLGLTLIETKSVRSFAARSGHVPVTAATAGKNPAVPRTVQRPDGGCSMTASARMMRAVGWFTLVVLPIVTFFVYPPGFLWGTHPESP